MQPLFFPSNQFYTVFPSIWRKFHAADFAKVFCKGFLQRFFAKDFCKGFLQWFLGVPLQPRSPKKIVNLTNFFRQIINLTIFLYLMNFNKLMGFCCCFYMKFAHNVRVYLESVVDKFPKTGYLYLCSQNDDSKTNRFCDFSRQNIAIILNGIHD